MSKQRRKSPRVIRPGEDRPQGQVLNKPGTFNLVNLDGGYIGVADRTKQEVSGYLVPKHIAALYYRFWSIAPAVQKLRGYPNPTKEQFEEIMKRYCNKLGKVHEDMIADAIDGVMGADEWFPAEAWNPDMPNKFVSKDDLPDFQYYDEEEEIGTETDDEGERETDDQTGS